MTSITSIVVLIFSGILLQMANCSVVTPYYSTNPPLDPYYPYPSLNPLQNQGQYQAQQAFQNSAAYQALQNNAAYQALQKPTLNPDIIKNNPLFNYKDILNYPPYALFCDCECSPYLDQSIVIQINKIADRYNQRECDLQQLDLIIDSIMPSLPDHPWRMNMIEDLAKGLYDEQARRQLADIPEYPGFCKYIYPEAFPSLAKRSPNEDLPSSLVPPSSFNPMAYYYNLNYLMDKIMPDLSPQFKQDIKDAVYTNTTPQELGQAPELIRRLTSNLRVTISQMYDYTPSFY